MKITPLLGNSLLSNQRLKAEKPLGKINRIDIFGLSQIKIMVSQNYSFNPLTETGKGSR